MSGDYTTRNLRITRERMEEMIRNHTAANVDPAIDREHESVFTTQPAAAHGWVKSLRIEPAQNDARRHALVASVEWTDLGQQAIRSKHYRYLSAGIRPSKHRQTGEDIGWVLDHVALVKNPFIQGMTPLSMSTNGTPEAKTMDSETLHLLGLSSDADETAIAARVKQLASDAEGAKALKAEVDKHVEALAAKATLAAEKATEVEKLSARVQALETEKLVTEVDGAIAAFKIDHGERDKFLSLGQRDAGLMRDTIALRQAKNPGGDPVNTGTKTPATSKAEAQEQAVNQYLSAHPGTDYGEALSAVAKEQPALFQGEV